MRQTLVALTSLLMLALFLAALVLNLAPRLPDGAGRFEVVKSSVEGEQ